MKTLLPWIALLLLATTALAGPAENWVVLPGSQAAHVLAQCSRAAPPHIDGTWEVSPAVAKQLEADLPKLAADLPKLTAAASKSCCTMEDSRMRHLLDSRRQYVGIVIQGHQYVYINAFPDEFDTAKWRTSPVGVCDGGPSFWGALYDPATHRFSGLAFNGYA